MSVGELLLSLITVFAIGSTGIGGSRISKNVREIITAFGLENMESGQAIMG